MNETTCTVKIEIPKLGIGEYYQTYDKFLYAQVSCEQDDDDLIDKNHMGLIVSVFGLLICFIFRLVINYSHAVDEINDKLYDLNFVTVSDYTVAGVIKPEMYQKFRSSLMGLTELSTWRF